MMEVGDLYRTLFDISLTVNFLDVRGNQVSDSKMYAFNQRCPAKSTNVKYLQRVIRV